MKEIEKVYYGCEVNKILYDEHLFISEMVDLISNETLEKYNKGKDCDFGCGEVTNIKFENVGFQLYFTDNKTTLEEAQEYLILDTIGLLEGEESWYGYSEWTILGWEVDNFTVGGHDILEILNSHKDQYVHFIVTFYE